MHLATGYNRVAIVVLTAYEIVAVGGQINPMPGETTEEMVLYVENSMEISFNRQPNPTNM